MVVKTSSYSPLSTNVPIFKFIRNHPKAKVAFDPELLSSDPISQLPSLITRLFLEPMHLLNVLPLCPDPTEEFLKLVQVDLAGGHPGEIVMHCDQQVLLFLFEAVGPLST